MTSEELVKSMLAADSCDLLDRVRINNLIENAARGYGKIFTVDDDTICVVHLFSKTKKLTYYISKTLLTSAQLSKI